MMIYPRPLHALAHTVLRLVPEGTMLPILGGPLRGWWFVRHGAHLGYNSGGYEPAISWTIAALLRPGDCFYDLGAHLGFHTLLGAKCVGSSGVVVAFEPRQENVRMLWRNVRTNHVRDRVLIYASAVADTDGAETWQQVEGATNLGKLAAADVHPEWHNAPFTTIRVRTVTLDWLVKAGLQPPQVIKVDVEGAEARVLRGAEHTLKTHKPALVLSVHGTRQTLACVEILGEYGYGIEPIHGDDVLLCVKR